MEVYNQIRLTVAACMCIQLLHYAWNVDRDWINRKDKFVLCFFNKMK